MNERKVRWRTAWVTGASSGMGRALAAELARCGCRVVASARSADKLAALAGESANIHPLPLDVADGPATRAAAATVMRELDGPPDIVILSAGIGRFSNAARLDPDLFREAMVVNVISMGDALAPIIPAMVERGSGHIVLVGSLAGYRGLPRGVTYAPSKAAVISLAECLRFDLAPKGIDITMINPGYVDTPMSRGNDFPMPFMVPIDTATEKIMDGLERRRFEIRFPWQMGVPILLASYLSNWSYFRIMRHFLKPRRKR